MARKRSSKKTAKKSHSKASSRSSKVSGESKLFAFLVVLLSILGFVIALLTKKDDDYIMFYAKQSLIIFLGFLICTAIAIVPVVGWIVSPLLWVVITVVWVVEMIFSLTGKKKETLIIGKYADELKI